ncbi:DUF523 domain-containing protein [Phocicoccus pinnipedialis]|uniref:Uncharacterized protein n=1 Tax=Phocicoccus pinnipedialis TaxID=110845 RepID=A0A6V7R798_9BACL|nr:DUF523 domain-containing protein [Jeotgalicoccus pinnipedialis]MBP1938842.1 uncharacterized protein YbbK (DUF523 family) [Jeotgalicoccus pinnipedialis]CAD2073330.1 hypothetical protein JEOPIN946_00702 [Jeotgalicoccus pinnipedialis]
MILISACLVGQKVRYDGKAKYDARCNALIESGQAISACPEVLGGLSTPRDPAEIVGGDGFNVWEGSARVITHKGEDVTEAYKRGAARTLEIVQEMKCNTVILKANSPSCSSVNIYDGNFSGQLNPGVGVTTALFLNNGIDVYDEHSYFMEN